MVWHLHNHYEECVVLSLLLPWRKVTSAVPFQGTSKHLTMRVTPVVNGVRKRCVLTLLVSIAFDRVVRIPRIQRSSLREPLRGVCLKCVCYDPSFPQLTIPGILLTLAATFAREKEAPFSLCVSAVSVHDRPPSSHALIQLVTSQYTVHPHIRGNGHLEGKITHR